MNPRETPGARSNGRKNKQLENSFNFLSHSLSQQITQLPERRRKAMKISRQSHSAASFGDSSLHKKKSGESDEARRRSGMEINSNVNENLLKKLIENLVSFVGISNCVSDVALNALRCSSRGRFTAPIIATRHVFLPLRPMVHSINCDCSVGGHWQRLFALRLTFGSLLRSGQQLTIPTIIAFDVPRSVLVSVFRY